MRVVTGSTPGPGLEPLAIVDRRPHLLRPAELKKVPIKLLASEDMSSLEIPYETASLRYSEFTSSNECSLARMLKATLAREAATKRGNSDARAHPPPQVPPRLPPSI